ncbi:transcription factor IIA subunit alpha [Microsporum canis]|uniref:Transcription initiation factor TFIIA large subunit n=1 Tax=Arthroderma otae (strain ATCC MYA-4605 / CBS 113480) TaxID=554155 RepID=C5FUT3_ARTOC|nr:transcription initiation factor TFIIA large subunit [Microsporum canis CBS 113480]EEQ33667.1 transcription initiation factor TFIIA large subunit [Microsporum canis CBS 113480]
MSNQLVGMVFDRVIQEVCDSSQIDFEESGVDQHALEELRKGWQSKLSSLGVAHFPWDPAPQPPASQPQATQQAAPLPPPSATIPSNDSRLNSQPQHHPQQQQQQQTHQPQHAGLQSPNDHSSGDVFIKSETGFSPSPPGPPAGTSLAQQRAANALHQKFGNAAANQVQHLQSHSQTALSLPGGQPRYNSQPMGNTKPQDFRPPQHQTQGQGQVQGQAQNQATRLPQTGIQNAQTDGAGDDLSDWKAEVQRRREAAAKNGAENDRRLREFVESRNLQLEGGGLLAPLHERYPNANGTKRKKVEFNDLATLSSQVEGSSSVPSSSAPPTHPQFDGPDDFGVKKDEDEDAINSDLDDPDDLLDDEQGEDDAVGQVMLCTYDKVQRVKSKWKCVLKDGILTSDGREYVFHKGTGEFEWY